MRVMMKWLDTVRLISRMNSVKAGSGAFEHVDEDLLELGDDEDHQDGEDATATMMTPRDRTWRR
jgi:hypothetical protein